MNRWLAWGVLGMATAAGAWADDATFTQVVRPEDFAAAGLSKLSPAELARLDQLIQDYKSGALQAAQQQAAAATAGQAAAEARASRAEAEAQAAKDAQASAEKAKEQAVTEAKEEKKASISLLAKAKAMLTPGAKVKFEPEESRILGDVLGWDSQTVFTLENGQRWQVADYSHYFNGGVVKNPKVVVKSAGMMGGFELVIEGIGGVRVRLLGEGIVHAPPSGPAPAN